MVFNGLQTIYSIMLMNRMLINENYVVPENTTLNEKFRILTNYKGVEQRYPNINLITIGYNNVSKNELNTKYNLINSSHNPTDAALFNHIPFYLRKLSEINEHPIPKNLRLRKIIYIDNEEYLVAYGAVVNDFVYKNEFVLLENVTDQYAKVFGFNFNSSDPLNPKPNTNLDMRYAPSSFINDFIKIYIFWDNIDLKEIKHAMDVLEINNNYTINEIGVCFSKGVVNTIHNAKKTYISKYMESIETQIAYFIDCNIDLKQQIQDFYIEIGGMQVLGNYK